MLTPHCQHHAEGLSESEKQVSISKLLFNVLRLFDHLDVLPSRKPHTKSFQTKQKTRRS